MLHTAVVRLCGCVLSCPVSHCCVVCYAVYHVAWSYVTQRRCDVVWWCTVLSHFVSSSPMCHRHETPHRVAWCMVHGASDALCDVMSSRLTLLCVCVCVYLMSSLSEWCVFSSQATASHRDMKRRAETDRPRWVA